MKALSYIQAHKIYFHAVDHKGQMLSLKKKTRKLSF